MERVCNGGAASQRSYSARIVSIQYYRTNTTIRARHEQVRACSVPHGELVDPSSQQRGRAVDTRGKKSSMHTIAAPLISASTKLKFRDLHQIIISHVNFRDGSFLTEAHRRTEGCRLPRPNDWYHLLSLGIEFRSMQNAKTAIHYDCGSPLTGAGQPSGGIVGHTTRHTTRHDTTRHDTLFKLFDCIRKLMRVF